MPISRTQVGIISDTHGLLRPEAIDALAGVDRIIHAGDIGKPDILKRLAEIAPITAVRGNNDQDGWTADLIESQHFSIEGLSIFLIHDLNEIDFDVKKAGIDIVIAGHSHRPMIETRNGILFINPGSAGPRRFKLPVSLALLDIENGVPRARIEKLDIN